MLSFPFWMARLPDDASHSGLQPLAFSSPRKLATYLDTQSVQHWRLHLVTRYSAVTYLTELQLLGHAAIQLNPSEDGTGGTMLQITKVLESLTS